MPSSTAKPRAAKHTGHIMKSAVYATWGPPEKKNDVISNQTKNYGNCYVQTYTCITLKCWKARLGLGLVRLAN